MIGSENINQKIEHLEVHASGLTPDAPHAQHIHYGDDARLGTAKRIADSIRDGEGVLIIHGVDYGGNGTYNFSDPEGGSELTPDLPAEAADPAVCGVLR